MKLRRILFWIHLTAGVVAGIVIFTMSVTGVILAYEKQIFHWANREYRVSSSAGQQSFAASELLAVIQDAEKRPPSAMTLRRPENSPVEFVFGRERVVFVNPYNTEPLGESHKLPAFFSFTEDVHRWLGAGEENRATGRAVTGACNLAFLVLVGTGPFIWWPKEWTWINLKKIVLFRRGLADRALYWNWHNVCGIWSAAPLFIIVLTGVIMSYGWANNLLYRVTGNEPPQSPSQRSSPQRKEAQTNAPKPEKKSEIGDLEKLLTFAKSETPDWQTITIRMPSGRGPLLIIADAGNAGRPDLRSQYSFDPKTSELRRETFASYNAGRRLRTWARFSHTGEAAGFLGQTIAALASASATFLAFTGIVLSIKRLQAWRAKAR